MRTAGVTIEPRGYERLGQGWFGMIGRCSRPSRKHKPWTIVEDRQLLRRLERAPRAGDQITTAAWFQIARAHKRTPLGVKARAGLLQAAKRLAEAFVMPQAAADHEARLLAAAFPPKRRPGRPRR